MLLDWRLRKCDYGRCNGIPAAEMHAHRRDRVREAYGASVTGRSNIAPQPISAARSASLLSGTSVVVK